ncbi:hypothetical protein LCGC14_1010720 [marine sediment metagenome]|uniref:Uncharacterized protein n=1 Tax=marine sediment metagenome TaxID=412755 RepID=A0A0F9NLR3_9ZZZZ|nr:MAG: hypothetical protein Lokiarch_27100 [Candidatus Lokiarchaeum sp. GC14_75]
MFTIFLTFVISYWAYSNLFLSLLTYVKVLTVYGIFILTINIAYDTSETLPYWSDPEKRVLLTSIKIKQTFFETLIVFIVNAIILVVAITTKALNFIYEHPLNVRFISYYQPTFLETVLIVIIMILSLLAIWTSMYWFMGRFLQIKEYSKSLKIFILKPLNVFICLIIVLTIFLGVLYMLDSLFIEVKVDGDFENIEFLRDISKNNYIWILFVEMFILSGINLVFYFNGAKKLSERNNFIQPEKEKSDIKLKEKIGKDKRKKKDFKTLIFETLIVLIILLPFFFTFLLVWIANGIFLFFWISLGFLISCYLLIIFIVRGQVSIL